MGDSGKWRRVSKHESCPICSKQDWCLVTGPERNPTAAICARIESAKRVGRDGGGWLHRLRDDGYQQPRRRTVRIAIPAAAVTPDVTGLAHRYEKAIRSEALGRLADSLGLSVDSLRRLRVGWSAEHWAYSFPMTDAGDKVLGIRLRLPNGRKLSVRGGREGLFIPADLADAGPLLISEGPTDCAALVDLGFACVGRPNCTGGVRLLVDLVCARQVAKVVIVADFDAHGRGQRGADNLAAVLVAYSQSVCVIVPPSGCKDAREWKRSGATRSDILAAIDATPVRRLSIQTKKVGKHADTRG